MNRSGLDRTAAFGVRSTVEGAPDLKPHVRLSTVVESFMVWSGLRDVESNRPAGWEPYGAAGSWEGPEPGGWTGWWRASLPPARTRTPWQGAPVAALGLYVLERSLGIVTARSEYHAYGLTLPLGLSSRTDSQLQAGATWTSFIAGAGIDVELRILTQNGQQIDLVALQSSLDYLGSGLRPAERSTRQPAGPHLPGSRFSHETRFDISLPRWDTESIARSSESLQRAATEAGLRGELGLRFTRLAE